MSAIRREILYEGWATFGVAHFAEHGNAVKRVYEDHGAASCVLPYDPDRRVALLVTQHRIGPALVGQDAYLREAPAGGLENEDPRAGAIREIFEETGVRLHDVEFVGAPFTMPSVSTERVHMFLAEYCPRDRIAPGGGLAEEGEFLEIAEVPLAELAAAVAEGTLDDMKTLALVLLLQQRRPELFQPPTQPTDQVQEQDGGRDRD